MRLLFVCFLLLPVLGMAQTVDSNYVKGKIYVKLKDAKRAARKFISSFGFLVLLAAIPQLIILPTMCFILTFFNEFKRRQNNKFTRHLARGGKQYSKWKVAALCTMFYTIFFLIFFIIRIDSV